MFEKYNVENLYLAVITVFHSIWYVPDNDVYDIPDGKGGMKMEWSAIKNRYVTVLWFDGENYIDLKYLSKVETTRNYEDESYVIDFKDSFTYYYNEEKKKNMLSRREALSKARFYFDEFLEKREASKLEEGQLKRKKKKDKNKRK